MNFLNLQKILGKVMSLPEFTSSFCLTENASWPFFAYPELYRDRTCAVMKLTSINIEKGGGGQKNML